jgi:hypothetical protein
MLSLPKHLGRSVVNALVSSPANMFWQAQHDNFILLLMTDKTKLLAEVIRHVPNGTKWLISSDSLEEITHVLRGFIQITRLDWIIEITETNRNDVASIVEKNDLAMGAIHMTIESKEHVVLFKSYDIMCTICMDKDFYNSLNDKDLLIKLDVLV